MNDAIVFCYIVASDGVCAVPVFPAILYPCFAIEPHRDQPPDHHLVIIRAVAGRLRIVSFRHDRYDS